MIWDKTRAEVMQEAVGNQSIMNYIGRQQVTVAQCLALRPIFEVYVGDKG